MADQQFDDHAEGERARIQREADAVDVHRYQKRFRAMKAIGLGAAGAGLVWLVLLLVDSKRNPCARVRDHLCRDQAPTKAGVDCRMYTEIAKESEQDGSPTMRQTIRAQCQTKIERLKEEDGIIVK
jgi:hypothetical protein